MYTDKLFGVVGGQDGGRRIEVLKISDLFLKFPSGLFINPGGKDGSMVRALANYLGDLGLIPYSVTGFLCNFGEVTESLGASLPHLQSVDHNTALLNWGVVRMNALKVVLLSDTTVMGAI